MESEEEPEESPWHIRMDPRTLCSFPAEKELWRCVFLEQLSSGDCDWRRAHRRGRAGVKNIEFLIQNVNFSSSPSDLQGAPEWKLDKVTDSFGRKFWILGLWKDTVSWRFCNPHCLSFCPLLCPFFSLILSVLTEGVWLDPLVWFWELKTWVFQALTRQ